MSCLGLLLLLSVCTVIGLSLTLDEVEEPDENINITDKEKRMREYKNEEIKMISQFDNLIQNINSLINETNSTELDERCFLFSTIFAANKFLGRRKRICGKCRRVACICGVVKNVVRTTTRLCAKCGKGICICGTAINAALKEKLITGKCGKGRRICGQVPKAALKESRLCGKYGKGGSICGAVINPPLKGSRLCGKCGKERCICGLVQNNPCKKGLPCGKCGKVKCICGYKCKTKE